MCFFQAASDFTSPASSSTASSAGAPSAVHAASSLVRLRHGGQALQLCLQLPGQRDEASVAQRHEASLRRVEAIEQKPHLQHLVLVQGDRAVHGEPVAVLPDAQLHLAGG